MAHHPGQALLASKNSPLAKAVQSLDVARLRELLDGGVDANTRIGSKTAVHELCSTDLSAEPGDRTQGRCFFCWRARALEELFVLH